MPTDGIMVAGWEVSGDQLRRKKDDDFVEVLPFAVHPREVYLDEDDQVRGFALTLRWVSGRETEVVIPARVLRSSRPGDVIAEAGGPDLVLPQARVLVDLLSDVANGLSTVPEVTVVTRAEWDGETLRLPGVSGPASRWHPELAAYGEVADVSETEARRRWRRIVEAAVDHSKLVTVLGMPIGSLYTVPLQTDSFALHLTGESHSGKTESAELAMSTLGSARRPFGKLYRTWNMSEQAPTNLLKLIGVLPVWFDEAATIGEDNEEFTRLLFRLAQGRARLVADTEGSFRDGSDARWTACVLSTGEARLSTRSGLTGMRRRVMEVYAPLLRNGEDLHSDLMSNARRAYGWPARWLVADPGLERAHRLHEELFGDLSEMARGQQVEVAQASNVAVCVMGFAQLARVVEVEVSVRKLKTLARSMFEKLMRAAEDEGADVGERGLRAVKEAIQTTNNFPAPDETLFIRRWGVMFDDGTVGVMGPSTLAAILRDFGGLSDPQPVLDKWDELGVLVHDTGKYTTRRRVHVPGKGMRQSRMHVLRL